MMPAKPGNEDGRQEHGRQAVLQSATYSQPWWRGAGNNGSLVDSASKSPSMEHLNGSVRNCAMQSKETGLLDDGAKFSKEVQGTVASHSGFSRKCTSGKDADHLGTKLSMADHGSVPNFTSFP